jgi:hypothetical protein
MLDNRCRFANDSLDELADAWYVVNQPLDLSSPIDTGREVPGFKNFSPT